MESKPHARSRLLAWPVWLAGLTALALIFLLLLGVNMRRGLNHDEHQFVGSAVLMARHGLLPYADFAYFHVPGQTLLTAALLMIADYFLLTARLLSIVSGWLGLAMILAAGIAYAPFERGWTRLSYALSGVVTLAAAPMFVHTSGRAWNHDLPMLLTLTGFFALLRVFRRPQDTQPASCSACWITAAGIVLGLAAATRLSYAFLAPAFALGVWLWGSAPNWRARSMNLLWLLVGGIVGMAPVWWAIITVPAPFLFGNVIYNLRLNPLYYATIGGSESVTMQAKAVYLANLMVAWPANMVAPLLFVASLIPAIPHLRSHEAIPLKMVLLILPFALFSAMSPTPSQIQYYYVLFPFLILGFFFAVHLWSRRQHLAVIALLVGAAISVSATAISYADGLAIVLQPQQWYPLKVHDRSLAAARLVGDGPVLTLAPIHAMEGGASIYPEFVTGPMAWRVAPFVSAEDRAKFGFVDEKEMSALLAQEPPRAILTGFKEDDAELEALFLRYAKTMTYVPVPLPDEGVLWLSPVATWNDAILLGAIDLPVSIAAGDEFITTLFLMKQAPIEQNLNVLVRIVNAEGREIARSEGWPYGSSTRSWQEGDMWPDGHRLTIAPDAAPGLYRVEVSFYDPETLAPFGNMVVAGFLDVTTDSSAENSSVPNSGAIEPVTPLATFAQGVDLLAVDVGAEPWHAGESQVRISWRPQQALTANYTFFVHLIGPDGALVAQRDQPPLQGFYPSDRWLRGRAFQDQYNLTLADESPPGAYQLLIGLYDPATGERLPLVEGESIVADAFQKTVELR